MTPDLELLAEALGSVPHSSAPMNTGGYTRSRAFRVATSDGLVFAKEADDDGSLHMLRREAIVYRNVRGPFLPAFVGFADSGERAVLAIEFLADARWPPPYPDDLSPLFDALDLVAASASPPELPVQDPWIPRWERVAADPKPLLGLGLCSQEWLAESIDSLIRAESEASFAGDDLVHNDVYSGNVGFGTSGAVLVDWGAAVRGTRWVDVVLALLSLRVEGAVPPAVASPEIPPLAVAFAGHFALEAPAPLPDWAEEGSTLREDMAGDLAHALQWAVELLDLPPLR